MKFKATLHSHKRGNGTHQLLITLTDNYKRKYVKVKGVFVKKSDWNKKSGKVREGRDNSIQVNDAIKKEISRIEDEYLKDTGVNIGTLYNRVVSQKTRANDLLGFIDEYIKKCKEGKAINHSNGMPIKRSTARGYETFYYRLDTYCKAKQYVSFSDIDSNFYSDYVFFLRFEFYNHAERMKHQEDLQGLSENSIGQDIKNIKKFMLLAKEAGLTNNEEYKRFKRTDIETDAIALNEKEIEMMADYDTSEQPDLLEEQDRFLCSYNFLLRFMDSISFNKGNIVEDDGKRYMTVRTEKTGERVMVPIMDRTWEILKRNDFELPQITNQESNRRLKHLGEEAKIKDLVTTYEKREGKIIKKTVPKYELISTHTARRSGATNMWRAKIPIKLIMDIGGWETEEQFFKYIRISKKESAKIASEHSFFK